MGAEYTNDSENFTCVGSSPQRLDARRKVTGAADFIEDIQVRGMLYAKLLRSPYPHARILSIDTTPAEKLPGVVAVVTGEDLPFLHGESLCDDPFLAIGKVRYVGEGVAAVAAVDETTAEEALDLIEVVYQELPAVFDPLEAARTEAPVIHEDLGTYRHAPGISPIAGTNICNHFQLRKGDVEKGFSVSDHIFEDTFTTPMHHHSFIEGHGAICLIDDEGQMTLWTNNDSPYRCRREIANALNIPLNKVRIISAPYIGGNFGGKGGVRVEAGAIALAWKIRNRPIRIIYSREEEFCATIVRHPSVIRLKTGVTAEGKILARQAIMHWATGAYAGKGPTVCRFGGVSGAGPYNISNVSIDGYCVYTNRQIACAMRGYSGPQAAWAYESHMDIIARKLNIDPLEFRLRHVYTDGDTHTSGQEIYSQGLKECLEQVAVRMKWDKKSSLPNRGRGVACMERAIKTPFGSAAFMKVNEDGTVEISSSTTEVGQGSETVLCQIVTEELGILLEQVSKAAPDSAFTPFDASTTSSRSTFHMGNAVRMAAADAKAQILRLAAQLMSVNADDLAIEAGKVYIREKPEKKHSFAEVLGSHYGASATVLGRGFYYPAMKVPGKYFSSHMIFWLLGAHGVEVEVNRETGEVKILKVYAAHDIGRAIHPSNCEAQIQGGIGFGVGCALLEGYQFKEGDVLNPSFLHYKIPTALEMPEIEPILVENLHRDGPFGAKGVGETSNVPLPPAIANAIYDAVGVRIKDLPITPEKVLHALRKKAGAENSEMIHTLQTAAANECASQTRAATEKESSR
jgi:carbon-monoxide dehydrogenase large subunit